MTKKNGLFITFEGIDGSGKSTQIAKLRHLLMRKGKGVELIREPGGTSIGEKIRLLLLDKSNVAMSPETELLLFEAARAQIVKERILPALRAGRIVICDRFFDSTTAFQGYARGINLSDVESLNRFATGGVEPDLTFVLDLSPEIALERMQSRADGADRIEEEGFEFMNKVRAAYLELAASTNRMIVIDGTDSVDKVFETIERKVVEVLKI